MSNYLYTQDISEGVRKKIKLFVVLVAVAFLCLWMRIWYLQILKGENFKGLSENNRVRLVTLPSYRGEILDRNGKTLVSIRPSFNLYVIPEDAKDLDATLEKLSKKIEFDIARVKQEIQKAQPFANVLIKADIGREDVAYVEEFNRLLPGIHIKVEPLRHYEYKDLASHVLGYLGEISKDQLESMDDNSYRLGDLIGKEGIEYLYESDLKGENGYKEVEVDVAGRELQTLRKLPAESGGKVVLTIDLRIQKVVEQLMQGNEGEPMNGAVVVMKVQTGEILAMTSKPAFDPNLFASGISVKDWRKLIFDQRHPLQNKAIDGQYPPGSTYKIVTAYAALEEKVITPEATVFCPGYFRLGRGIYRCWRRGGHGSVNLYDALVQSCDVYFYTVGYRLGIDKLAEYARKFGLGNVTGINLVGEKSGLIPSTQWKEENKKEAWLPGETISASIGQGYNLVTPIQEASMAAIIANGGLLLRPYLVKQIRNKEGRVIQETFPRIVGKLESRTNSLEIIRNALQGVVNDKRGTGWRARLKNVRVSGKTGTAQVVRLRNIDPESSEEEEIPYEFRDHAWFVGFAPFDNPEISVSVIVEHGGHGGATAAPIVRKIIETYFKYYPIEDNTQDASNEALMANNTLTPSKRTAAASVDHRGLKVEKD